ncbi:MAG: TolC family protein [Deltaproteobacteria bacterium]|nr:TolC family protein [Deltaproteobacteria bacterium]
MRILLLLISVVCFAEEQELTNIGLDEAKKYAIDHNFEVLALRKQHEQAKASHKRSHSPFFPKIGIGAGADSKLSKTSETAGVGFLYGNYNLFNGFEDSYRTRISEIEAEKAEIQLKRVEFRVGLEVEQVFHFYLFKKGAMQLKKEAIELNNTHKKMAAQRRASGLASDADVMEFDLRDSLLRSDMLLLAQELEEARANLRKLFGEEIGSKIEPRGALQHQHLEGVLMDYVKRIKDESEPVQLAARDVAIATTEEKLSQSRWLPKLDLEARVGYLPLDQRAPDGGVTISGTALAKLDLFSGFDTFWEKRELAAKKLKSEAKLKNMIVTAMTQMEIAFRKVKTVQSRVDLEEENSERALKYYKSVVSEYKRGVKNSADVKVAAELLYETYLRREGYKYDFLTGKIELERLLGSSVVTEIVTDNGKQ